MSDSTASVLLTHDVGLHARPSVKLTKLAKSFSCAIELAVTEEGPWIDAKSIVKVMAAKAPKDTVLHFRADGPDSDSGCSCRVAPSPRGGALYFLLGLGALARRRREPGVPTRL